MKVRHESLRILSHVCHGRDASTLLSLYRPMARLGLNIVPTGIARSLVPSHGPAWGLGRQGQWRPKSYWLAPWTGETARRWEDELGKDLGSLDRSNPYVLQRGGAYETTWF